MELLCLIYRRLRLRVGLIEANWLIANKNGTGIFLILVLFFVWVEWVEWVVKSSVGVVEWSRLHRDEKIKAASERPRRRRGLKGLIGLRLNGLYGLDVLGGDSFV